MSDSLIIKLWFLVLGVFSIYIIYGLIKISTFKELESKYKPVINYKESKISILSEQIEEKDEYISDLNFQVENLEEKKIQLSQEKQNLEGRIAGITTQRNQRYPFVVPTNGVIGSFAGTFGGNMYGLRHLGIDIWTTLENNGRTSSNIGNPVYAACSGVVNNSDPANGAVTIECDPIPLTYNLPDYEVYTYYAHMGNGVNKSLYIKATPSRRVEKGDLIGYQGNISKFFPNMRNVHLHFSVFGGLSEIDKNKGAYNPCLYIGGDCKTKGANFTVNL